MTAYHALRTSRLQPRPLFLHYCAVPLPWVALRDNRRHSAPLESTQLWLQSMTSHRSRSLAMALKATPDLPKTRQLSSYMTQAQTAQATPRWSDRNADRRYKLPDRADAKTPAHLRPNALPRLTNMALPFRKTLRCASAIPTARRSLRRCNTADARMRDRHARSNSPNRLDQHSHQRFGWASQMNGHFITPAFDAAAPTPVHPRFARQSLKPYAKNNKPPAADGSRSRHPCGRSRYASTHCGFWLSTLTQFATRALACQLERCFMNADDEEF